MEVWSGAVIRLELLREDTRILSTLCAKCPQGPSGCCVAPPEHDWSDLGLAVSHGHRDWLLAQIAERRLVPGARGLAIKLVKRREGPALPRERKCVFHGKEGCTIRFEQRPATCNYFVCEDVFIDGGGDGPAARRAHATLKDAFERWDRALVDEIAARFPDGPTWDAAFLDWLGERTAALARGAPGGLAALDPAAIAKPLDPRGGSAMIPPMSKLTLKLRDLMNGDTSFRELAGEEAALAFLRERPRFTEVLGVVFEGLTREQNDRLKAAMRPLDDDERAAEKQLEEKAARAAEAAQEKRRKEEETARAAHREAMKTADPNRLMEVRYRYDGSIAPVDPEDTRPLSDEVKAAVMAWVAERNEWVESRNQVVGEAKISLWPGALPKPGADRIKSGSFVPVSAPAKPG